MLISVAWIASCSSIATVPPVFDGPVVDHRGAILSGVTIMAEANSLASAIFASKPIVLSWTLYFLSGFFLFILSMGQKVPSKIYQETKARTYGVGLELPRGPDPRSYNPRQATLATLGRSMLGLDL